MSKIIFCRELLRKPSVSCLHALPFPITELSANSISTDGTDKKAPAFNVMQYMAIIDNYAQDSGHSYALHWCVEKVKENLFNAVLVWGLEKDTLQSVSSHNIFLSLSNNGNFADNFTPLLRITSTPSWPAAK
jgi:hypothetical protein